MNSYALMKNGSVVDMSLTGKTLTEMKEAWPDYDELPESWVPQEAMDNYRYWSERP